MLIYTRNGDRPAMGTTIYNCRERIFLFNDSNSMSNLMFYFFSLCYSELYGSNCYLRRFWRNAKIFRCNRIAYGIYLLIYLWVCVRVLVWIEPKIGCSRIAYGIYLFVCMRACYNLWYWTFQTQQKIVCKALSYLGHEQMFGFSIYMH